MIKLKTLDGVEIFLKIDRDICIGAGSCAALAPETFGLDDKGLVFLIENSTFDNFEDILAGAQSCPVFAIIVYDSDMKQIWPEEIF